jgi:flagellar hook protein FlgE
MSFQTGLSGLNASSRNLDVIGNNIANANTVGMKSSRVEFANLIATSNVGGSGSAGIGVEVATTSQQFSQGNINITGNDLDVAINGGGFFQLRMPDGSAAYTRDGEFKLDKLGNVITNTGANVMGYPTDTKGVPISTTVQALQLPTSAPIGASATTAITAEFNLDARANLAAGVPASVGPPPVAAIPPTPLTTYGTSLTVYDSQGVGIPVTVYMRKTASDTWEMFTDPTSAATATTSLVATLNFGTNGVLTSTTPAAPVLSITSPNATIGTFTATLDVTKATQYGAAFGVSNLTQDGYAPGELVGLKIGANGVITARYSNGQTQAAGQVALANFRNVQGLSPTGGGNWIQTYASGDPVQGTPGQGKFGSLSAGALEESNVDLTSELVNMMTAQRAYQANAQTIKTQDQVLSTLVNLR